MARFIPGRSPDYAPVADAVSGGKPSVITFATPAFCRTATCGFVTDGELEAALATVLGAS